MEAFIYRKTICLSASNRNKIKSKTVFKEKMSKPKYPKIPGWEPKVTIEDGIKKILKFTLFFKP
jgi:hypothetical protein